MSDTAVLELPAPTKVRGEMSVLNRTGDFKVIWDSDQPAEVEQARKTFNDLKTKGYAAFKVVSKDGAKGEQVRIFDPNEERLIMVPAIVGG